jgi:hypothetical protein
VGRRRWVRLRVISINSWAVGTGGISLKEVLMMGGVVAGVAPFLGEDILVY